MDSTDWPAFYNGRYKIRVGKSQSEPIDSESVATKKEIVAAVPMVMALIFPFLKLPPEIRLIIYKFVLPTDTMIRQIGPKTYSLEAFFKALTTSIALFFVSRTVYQESRQVFFNQNSTAPHLGLSDHMPKFYGSGNRDLFGLKSLRPHHVVDLASFRTIHMHLHYTRSASKSLANLLNKFCSSIAQQENRTGKNAKVVLRLKKCFFSNYTPGNLFDPRYGVLKEIKRGVMKIDRLNCAVVVEEEEDKERLVDVDSITDEWLKPLKDADRRPHADLSCKTHP